MMGEKNSVASRLKSDLPGAGVMILKCVCHSLHLCASEACKELPRELEELVRGVYNFMHMSSKRMALFEQFQKFLDLKIHKLLQPSQTRWLSVIAAVTRVLEQWDALKLFFTDMLMSEKTIQSEQIYKWLHDPFMKMYLLFIKFILPRFTELNEYFQSSQIVITNLHNKIKAVYRDLLLTFMKRDYVLKKFDTEIIDPNNQQFWLANTELYLGVDIFLELQKKDVYLQKENVNIFLNSCRAFLVRGCSEILKRYNFQDPVLEKLEFLRQREALSSDFRQFHPTIMPLVLALPRIAEGYDFQELDNEWRKLSIIKDQLPDDITKPSGDDAFWFKLSKYRNILDEEEFNSLPKFALDVLCPPHANADCERIFSKLNNIKTKSRNKLRTETVNGILLASEGIKSSGDCTSFKITESMLSKMTSANLYKYKNKRTTATSNQPSTSTGIGSTSSIQTLLDSEDDEDDIIFDDD